MVMIKSFPAPTGQALSRVDNSKDLAGQIVRTTAGVCRAGIFPRHVSGLAVARASMGVDVSSFEAVLVKNGYPQWIANDGTVTVSVGSAPVSNSLYSIVYAQQLESQSPFADGSDVAKLDFVQGASSASPVLATALALVPSGAIPIAAVLIPSTATTTLSGGVVITPVFPYTALTGSAIWVRDAIELAVTTGTAAMNGYAIDQKAYNMALDVTMRWTGAAWVILPKVLYAREEQTANTAGGTFTAGSFVKRTLNIIPVNDIAGASITTSVITLPAGVYDIEAWAPCYFVDQNKLKLRQTSGTAADLLIGQSHMANTSGGVAESLAHLKGRITLTASQTLELQHRCTTTRGTNGFGVASNFGVVEVYSEITITKVG